ncbi:MAG TPA: UpxY family transcription antiterminator [Lacibacter sp.]|nr:UpxY family transcription antiterminator [Lacibacter sp.]HMO90538.1 UpxY family transcription antiterminator [Lacibacter sp.]
MPVPSTPHWYAVYSRPNMEKKIAEALALKGIVVYCPVHKVRRRWSDRYKVLEVPAFRGYVFVQIHDDIRWTVLATPGVLNFVCHEGKPARIPAREIETVRLFFNDIEQTILDETDVRVSDVARVHSGVLMGMEGEVVDIQHRYAILNIPSLGLHMQVKVPRHQVSVVKRKTG